MAILIPITTKQRTLNSLLLPPSTLNFKVLPKWRKQNTAVLVISCYVINMLLLMTVTQSDKKFT
jgi:hypothetical protein